ncbi:unnamed protein product [Caretta caretta]
MATCPVAAATTLANVDSMGSANLPSLPHGSVPLGALRGEGTSTFPFGEGFSSGGRNGGGLGHPHKGPTSYGGHAVPDDIPSLLLIFSHKAVAGMSITPTQVDYRAHQELSYRVVQNLNVQVKEIEEFALALVDILTSSGPARVALPLNDAILQQGKPLHLSNPRLREWNESTLFP